MRGEKFRREEHKRWKERDAREAIRIKRSRNWLGLKKSLHQRQVGRQDRQV